MIAKGMDALNRAVKLDPDYFEALNRDFRYQLTVLDESDSAEFVQAKVVRKIAGATRPSQANAAAFEEAYQDAPFVRLRGEVPWGTFRDVFEVDGRTLPDRQDRLRRLFLEQPASALARANEIAHESARYNLGCALSKNGQRIDAVRAVLPTLVARPGWTSLRNVLSMLKG